MTKEYYGTKKITAWEQEKDGKPGYAVKYADGYTSWSPKDVFEEAYQTSGSMNYGHAVFAAKEGKKISRSGWNGKGMFVIYVPGTKDAKLTDGSPYQKALNSNIVTINPHFDMYTATGEFQPGWLASQTDMDASDWGIIADKTAEEAQAA